MKTERTLYFNCPTDLCRNNVTGPLERVKAKAEGEVKTAIEQAVVFLNYCIKEHSYEDWLNDS